MEKAWILDTWVGVKGPETRFTVISPFDHRASWMGQVLAASWGQHERPTL